MGAKRERIKEFSILAFSAALVAFGYLVELIRGVSHG